VIGPEDTPVQIEQLGRVRWLWLNRPDRRNALNDEIVACIGQALTDAESDPDTAAVVVAGRGRSFCAGADLSLLLSIAESGSDPVHFLRTVSETFSRFEASPLPIVVAAHGHVVAGGLELALAADVVVAAEGTLIGDGHLQNGLLPGAGSTVRLPKKVGPSLARWLLLTGELLPASAFERVGWLHAIVPEARIFATAQAVAEQLVERAGPAQTRLKSLLADMADAPAAIALEAELDSFGDHWKTASITDSLRAFFSDRTAKVAEVRLET